MMTKDCLATRTQKVKARINECCGGAGLHRPGCINGQTAQGSGRKGWQAQQHQQAMAAMREATGLTE